MVLEPKIVTIFCAFTRPWAVAPWIESLRNTQHDRSQTHLVFIVDANEPEIANKLEQFAIDDGYSSYQIQVNHSHSPNEVRIALRRHRIAFIKQQSKKMIAATDCEYVIGLEDDTVLDRIDSLYKLTQPLVLLPHVGFVQGVQMGRWGARMIGAWKADNSYRPQRIETLLPPRPKARNTDLQRISAGGFYGYATRRDLYLAHDYHWDESQPWGPDVNYGLWLGKQGIYRYIDWSLIMGHSDHGRIGWPDEEQLTKIIFTRDAQTGKWEREDCDESTSRY